MDRERVVVIGGAGRLGRYVVKELGTTHHVVVVDQVKSALAETRLGDITDIAFLREVLRCGDCVVHVAGIDGHVQASAEDFFRVNVLGTWNVLKSACEARASKIITTSSTAATGLNDPTSIVAPIYLPIDEDHPTCAVDSYGSGKYAIENLSRSFSRAYDVPVICIRPTYIAFPELVAHLASRADGNNSGSVAFNEPLPLLRSYIEPTDLSRCYHAALEYDSCGYELFWASAEDTFEDQPTLRYAAEVYGRVPELRDPARYEANPRASLVDCSKAARLLGWRATSDWLTISQRCWVSPR